MRRLPALVVVVSTCLTVACGVESQPPLTAAAVAGRTAEVASLLAAGADPNERAGRGFSALGLAARSGQVAIIEQLVRAGADPDIRDTNENGWTPLLNAVHTHQAGSVDTLLRLGANPDLGGGLTPLIMAAGSGDTEMVRRLLDAGADPHLTVKSGENALGAAVAGALGIEQWTAGRCQTATVQLLLERAPDLRLQLIWFARPGLWAARLGGCTEVLKLVEGREKRRFAAGPSRSRH